MNTHFIHGYDALVWTIGQTELADNGLFADRNQTITLAFATDGMALLTLKSNAGVTLLGWIDEDGELYLNRDVKADWFREFKDVDCDNLEGSFELLLEITAREGSRQN